MFYNNLVPMPADAPALRVVPPPAPEAASWLPDLIALCPIGVYAGIAAARRGNATMYGGSSNAKRNRIREQ